MNQQICGQIVVCKADLFKNSKFAISNQPLATTFPYAHFVGYNKVSAGYYLARKIIYFFEPLRPLYQPLIR